MKKLIITVIVTAIAVCASAVSTSAQEFQPIGYAHTISFGAAYGYGSSPLANFASVMVDFNIVPNFNLPAYSYLRARASLNTDQVQVGICASLGGSFQYMQHIAAGLYIYPFVQVKGEYHNVSGWKNKADFTPGAGAGLEYQFSSNIGVFVQGAYDYAVTSGMSRPNIQAGLVFALGKGRSAVTKAKKDGLSAIVASNAAQARAARNAAQRAKAEQAAADKMRKEAADAARKAAEADAMKAAQDAQAKAEEAAQKIDDPTTRAAYTSYQTSKLSSVSVPFVQGSAEIGKTSKSKLLSLVPYLMTHPDAIVEIMAYGDKLSEKNDDTIAENRFKAVRDIFTGAGIATERIRTGKQTAAQSVTTQPGSVAIVTVR